MANLFIGSLAYATTDDSLKAFFETVGEVTSARVVTDRDTGRSKGFGFVEMVSEEVAQAAISGLNGRSVDGRSIVVNMARPREEGRSSGGYRDKGYTSSTRKDVGYGNGGFGGGRY